MLKNISSVISPDLLWLLASMGHGEDLVLVDRNFPAILVAKQTSTGRLIELPGLNIPEATRAILSLMPLDHFVEEPVTRMRVVDDPDCLLEIQREVIEIAGRPKVGRLRWALLSVLRSMRRPARASRWCALPNSFPTVVSSLKWVLFSTTDQTGARDKGSLGS
jgi:L-fucose mutarotase